MRWVLFPRVQQGHRGALRLDPLGSRGRRRRSPPPPRETPPPTRRSWPRCGRRRRVASTRPRATLEQERAERLAAVNAAIAERRAAAAAEVEAAKAAAQGSVETAVRDVAAAAGVWPPDAEPDDDDGQRGGERRDERWGDAMNALMTAVVAVIHRFPEAEHGIDDKGYTTHHPLWPEQAEIIYGGLASVIVFGLLIWKAGPLVKKAMAARTARSRVSSTTPPRRGGAEAEAAASASRSATSRPSASVCSPKPTPRRRRCSPTAAPGSRPRSPSSKPRPTPTSPPAPVAPATSCAARSPACPAPPPTSSSSAHSTTPPSRS